MKETKEYSNGEVVVVWQSHKCCHSGRCVTGLPRVFGANRRPWIDLTQATSQEIRDQVAQCPSGALTCREATTLV